MEAKTAEATGEAHADHAYWTTSRRVYVLVVLCLVAVVYHIDRQALSILIPPIKKEFRASDAEMGLLTGLVFAGAFALAGIPIARLLDRHNRRTVLAICLTGWSAMTALGGLAPTFAVLALTRTGVAVGTAGAPPAGYSILADIFPARRRATVTAIFAASQSIGIGLAAILGGALAQAFGWRTCLIVLGLPGLALAALLATTVREPPRGLLEASAPAGDPVPFWQAARRLWAIPTYRCLPIITALGGISGYGILIWGPTFMIRVHHMTQAVAGLWFGVTTVASLVLGNLAGGMLADRLGRRDLRAYMWIAAAGPLLSAPAGVWFALAGDWRLGMVGFFLSSFLLTSHIPSCYAMSQTLVPARIRATSSILLTASSTLIGTGLSPLIVGISNDFLSARFGAGAIRYSVAIVELGAVLAAVVAFIAATSIRRDYAALHGGAETA